MFVSLSFLSLSYLSPHGETHTSVSHWRAKEEDADKTKRFITPIEIFLFYLENRHTKNSKVFNKRSVNTPVISDCIAESILLSFILRKG